MKLMETTIPENYRLSLQKDAGYEVNADWTDDFAVVLFNAVSKSLARVASPEHASVFRFDDIQGQLIAAAVLTFEEGKDGEPGAYSYVWTFDEASIPTAEGTVVLKMSDPMVQPDFTVVAANKLRMSFEGSTALVSLMTRLVQSISKWLDDNAKEGETVEVEQEGLFVARAAVEDGKIVKSLEVLGEPKAIIKNDASIEVAA